MNSDDIVVTGNLARFLGRRFPCSLGRSGCTTKKTEGDGATPIGVFHIVGCLFRPDRVRAPNGWASMILPRDLWSDDSADPAYNNMVVHPHGFRTERLRRADPLYDIVLLTSWNWPVARPGGGSAIFVHRWRKPGHPTEGCIAFSPSHLRWIAQRCAPGTRIIVR